MRALTRIGVVLISISLLARSAHAQWRSRQEGAPASTSQPPPLILIEPQQGQRSVIPLFGDLDGPVAIDGEGQVTFLTDEGILGRLSAGGDLRWAIQVGPPGGAAAIGPDGVVYAAGRDGRLYAVGPLGQILWTAELSGEPVRGVAIGENLLAVALEDRRLELRHLDGSPIGWVALGGTPSGAAVFLGGERLAVPTRDGRVIAVADERARWSAVVSARSVVSPLAVTKERAVVAGASDGTVVEIAADGQIAWRVQTGASIVRSPVLAEDGTVLVAAGDSVVAISPVGEIAWRRRLGATIIAGPLVADDGSIYVALGGASASSIRVLGPDGSDRRAIDLPARPSRGLALASGSLWIGLEDSTLRRVDAPQRTLAHSSWAKARGDVANRGAP